LIGKVFGEDRTDIFRTMDDLQRAGFDANAEFGVPRPVAFLPALRLLIYEKAPGVRARKVISGSSGSGAAQAAERCAQWLAHFHVRGPRSEPVFTLQHHLGQLEQTRRSVAESDAPLAGKADQLFARLVTAAQRLSDHELRASHGTYTPGQVLLTEGRTVTIDWDTYQVADPAFDVARFLVELKRMGLKYTGSSDGFQSVAAVFLSTYTASGDPSVTQRLAFQQAAIFLNRAKHDLEKEEPNKAETMLDEGLRMIGKDGRVTP
jgi:aminoglycoside phosphotransferase (APT) family kinase protein